MIVDSFLNIMLASSCEVILLVKMHVYILNFDIVYYILYIQLAHF